MGSFNPTLRSRPIVLVLAAVGIGAAIIFACPLTRPFVDIALPLNPPPPPWRTVSPLPTYTPTATPTATPSPPPFDEELLLPPHWWNYYLEGGAAPAPEPLPPLQPAPLTYVVQAGDTLSGIAVRFATTTETLLELNGLSASTDIHIGQVLILPQSPPHMTPLPTLTQRPPAPTATPRPPTTPPPCSILQPTHTPSPGNALYIVLPGDTLAQIAARYGTTVDAIFAANFPLLIDPDQIYPGQVLAIPLPVVPIPAAAYPQAAPQATAPSREDTSHQQPTPTAAPIPSRQPTPPPISWGVANITQPTRLRVGESAEIRLQLFADAVSLELGAQPPPSSDVFPPPEASASSAITTTQHHVAIYPFVSAELRGDHFDIRRDDSWDPRIMTDDKPDAWMWDVVPNNERARRLRVCLWANDSIQEEGKFMYKEIPLEIAVHRKPWTQVFREGIADQWPTFLTTLIAVLLGSGGIGAVWNFLIPHWLDRKKARPETATPPNPSPTGHEPPTTPA